MTEVGGVRPRQGDRQESLSGTVKRRKLVPWTSLVK